MKQFLTALLLIITTTALAQQFKISYPASAFKGPFTGKVILFLNKENKQPKDAEVGSTSFPCFSIDVKNIAPGTPVLIDDKALSYPVSLTNIERGEYYVQAVWDRNLGGRAINSSAGNLFSKTIRCNIDKTFSKTFTLNCTEIIAAPIFKETGFIKELKAPSALLSAFHKKQMTVDAAILLPPTYYTEPGRKFPVLFEVSGYGGDYHYFSGDTVRRGRMIDTIPAITVYLDGNCALGHSVYANSDNNGPWGDALTKELIPLLESKYRTNGARLLRGHSSGGWTVLWLQTHYPATFHGCWSSAPDPVDFRDYQQVNLYAGENIFYDKDSVPRNVGTVAGFIPWFGSKQAYGMEEVIYRGQQMHSFDAVFSGKAANGEPARICNPRTGVMNANVFEHWKSYDISAYLRNNWATLKPSLDGKIRVTIGDGDNFLLGGAVHLLDKEMKTLNADMQFEYFPGDHFTVGTAAYFQKGMQFLAERYHAWLKK